MFYEESGTVMTSISAAHDRNHGRHSHRRHQSRRPSLWRRAFGELPGNLIAIGILWLTLLLFGGSSRGDVIQLTLLRPIAILVAGFGFWTLRWHHVVKHRFLVIMAAAITLLAGSHLIPLPPSMWMSLPGRQLIVDVDQSLGLGNVWRPITMAPAFGWNALFSLGIPLAVLVNGIQLTREDLTRIGPALIAGGIASAFLAFFQLFGTPNGILYPYSIRLQGPEAVGFFANRNHQALLIAAMFPLLAAYAARQGVSVRLDKRRFIVALVLGAFLIPLLIVTGSRAGLAVGIVGLISTPFIFMRGARVRRSDKSLSMWWKLLAGATAVLAIGGLSIATNRSIAIQRSLASLTEDDQRYESWADIAANYERFMPIGSGVGSYQPVFQTFERRGALTSSYSNHAHSDWIEVIMTTGIPGAALLMIAIMAFIWAAWGRFRAKDRGTVSAYSLAGLVIILMIGAASLVDYPVRAPIISAVLVLACLWAETGGRANAAGGRTGRTPELTEGVE